MALILRGVVMLTKLVDSTCSQSLLGAGGSGIGSALTTGGGGGGSGVRDATYRLTLP